MLAGVFIDGGYLSSILREHFGKMKIDHHRFANWACQNDEMFRTYYYDCLPYQSQTPTEDERERVSKAEKFFEALGSGRRFTVRKGRLEYRGEDGNGRPIFQQKQVDLRIGLDIAALVAKNRIGVVVLVTGDSDYIPVVQFAQQEGVIVRLVHGPHETYHRDLWHCTDERLEITRERLEDILL